MTTPSFNRYGGANTPSLNFPDWDPMSSHVVVLGAGAVGTFYAWSLFQAGMKVSFVCRSDYKAVKSSGLTLVSKGQNHRLYPFRVLKPYESVDEPVDVVVVALKVLPDVDTVALIRPLLSDNTVIILLQNGLDIEIPIASAFPNHEILSALAFICVSRVAPHVVEHFDSGRLTIGRYPNGPSVWANRLADIWNRFDVPVRLSETIIKERWRKLVWNAPFNPISVLGGCKNTADILNCPQSLGLVRQVMTEVVNAAVADGYDLDESVIARNIQDTVKMKPYKTSMLLDFEAGRPMEVEAILGNFIRKADELGVDVSVSRTLYRLLSLANAR